MNHIDDRHEGHGEDDVQGHRIRPRVSEEDDVEGHVQPPRDLEIER